MVIASGGPVRRSRSRGGKGPPPRNGQCPDYRWPARRRGASTAASTDPAPGPSTRPASSRAQPISAPTPIPCAGASGPPDVPGFPAPRGPSDAPGSSCSVNSASAAAPRRSSRAPPVTLPRAAWVSPTASWASPRHNSRSATGPDFHASSKTSWAWNGIPASSSRCASRTVSSGARTTPSGCRSTPGDPYGKGRPSPSRGRALCARPSVSRSLRVSSTPRLCPAPAANPRTTVGGPPRTTILGSCPYHFGGG